MEYIDLGLPSGTLWAIENEPWYYDYNTAVEQFGNSLPSINQYKELYNYATARYLNLDNNSLVLTFINGKQLTFQAHGFLDKEGYIEQQFTNGTYLSSTIKDDAVFVFTIDQEHELIVDNIWFPKEYKFSVRCIKNNKII